MPVEVLDYGVLGVFGLVLFGLGVGAWRVFKWFSERQAKLDEQAAKRLEDQSQFMQQVVSNGIQERKAANEQLRIIVERDIEAKAKLSAALDRLCVQTSTGHAATAEALAALTESVRQHESRSAERQAENLKAQREVVLAMRAANGRE